MRHRDTRLFAELPATLIPGSSSFCFPGGDSSYDKHLTSVKGQLPDKGVRTIRAGGYDFVTGPIALLPLLSQFGKGARAGCISFASLLDVRCKQT